MEDNELSPSKHQQHEQAAQVLNRTCPPPPNTKEIDVIVNGVRSLNSHFHDPENNQVTILESNDERNRKIVSSDDSLGVEIVNSHIEENSR